MRNLKLTIEYDGKNYCGWQTQKRRKGKNTARRLSIQETIEKTLRKIIQEKVSIAASGRTDSGVHAWAQVANFKTNSQIPAGKLQMALNCLLPADIVIKAIDEVGPDFHSCFNARSKTYRYAVLNRSYPSALLKDKTHFYYHPLDIALMRKEARSLLGRHDFEIFRASGSSSQTTVRTIKKISISTACYPLVIIDIEADGFLYNMVRKIVGTLLEIGRGRFKRGHIKKILRSKDINLCGPTVPAKGLFLIKVNY